MSMTFITGQVLDVCRPHAGAAVSAVIHCPTTRTVLTFDTTGLCLLTHPWDVTEKQIPVYVSFAVIHCPITPTVLTFHHQASSSCVDSTCSTKHLLALWSYM